MSFILYDVIFMVLSVILISIFLYFRRKNLKRQGILFLYPTKVGINFIEKVSRKYHKILKPMQYLVITSGYILMAFAVWIVGKLAYVYISSPTIARDIKVPILMPLVPYLPELFKITYLPPFYFTYWIIIIAVIAIPHEFAHGIIARINKIKIHSTGFGFLGPFLAAFVEPDEKKMQKSPKFAQLSVLAAGTFANVLVTLLCALFMWLFFMVSFHPAGFQFDSYSFSEVNISDISAINGLAIADWKLASLNPNETLVNLTINNSNYFVPPLLLKTAFAQNRTSFFAFDDSPALKANLVGTIIEVNNQKITSAEQLKSIILQSKPGDILHIKTKFNNEIKEYAITLEEKEGQPNLGITNSVIIKSNIFSSIKLLFTEISDPLTYHKYINNIVYESSIGDFGLFIYYLLWWLVLINFSVAFMNMLPMGLFDGGRFFLLTIWGITGSRKLGELFFKILTWTVLVLVAVMMIKWFFVIF